MPRYSSGAFCYGCLDPTSGLNWALLAAAAGVAITSYLLLGWVLKVEELRGIILRFLRWRHRSRPTTPVSR